MNINSASFSSDGLSDDITTNTTMNGPAPIAVYLYAGDQIVENVTTGYLYFQDSVGNTSHVTDAAGNLLERYTYSAFGQPSFFDSTSQPLNSSTHNIRHLFQGQLWTQETWLNDYRNRVELPIMGVFLQPDPIGFKGDAANLYRFCGNDAVNRTDSMGLYIERAIDFDPGLQGPGRDSAERMAQNNRNNLARLELTLANVAREKGHQPPTKGQSFEQRAHDPALEMLAKETHRPDVTQSGLILDGPPYRDGPKDEKMEHRNKFDLHSPYVAREELPGVPKGVQAIVVHYHHRTGPLFGPPSQIPDLQTAKVMTMYFTNREWAAKGEYLIYRRGRTEPEVHFSQSLVPTN